MKDKEIYKSRIFIVFVGICTLFTIITGKFFQLQVMEQGEHSDEIQYSTQRKIETTGVRGEIFDRYGKPLAINKPTYVLKLDQQVRMSKKEINESILKVIQLLEKNGDSYIDDIPLSKTAPFTFTGGESTVKLFINSIPYNGTEHRDELLTYSAQELFDYLKSDKVFQIDASYTDEEARKIIAIRHQMYQVAYQKYKPITIAEDISQETFMAVSEHGDIYPNIYAEVESYRYYPYGEAFGNILGYTRAITSSQYEEMKQLGYDRNDKIGQMGIEQTMEEELRGEDGTELIEVDNVGRKVRTVSSEEAVQGNDIFLTIDADIQLKTYEVVEKRLADAIVARLQGENKTKPLDAREILVSMVESNQIDFDKMSKALQGTMQYEVYQKISPLYEQQTEKNFKTFFVECLKGEGVVITDRELLLVLSEQGSLKLSEKMIERIWSGNYPSAKQIIIEALQSGALKPDQMAIDPYSASAVVTDVHTGEVLALVSYPSYDSNQMTTNFNTYYSMLQDGIDKRNLLWNRALMTTKAPGSTFKMLSALVGLEEGVVTPSTIISDVGPYPKAGMPQPRCWFFTNNGYGHGPADIYRALEVSCNYYFYELAYRLGLKYGGPYGAISAFTKYAELFGLNQKTGIELPETAPNVSNPKNLIESNITKALNVIRNVTEVGQETLDELAYEVLEEGGYESKKGLFKDISQSMINDFKNVFKEGVSKISRDLTSGILEDDSNRSMKAKTKDAMRQYLGSLVTKDTYHLIQKAEDTEEAETLQAKMIESLVDYLIGDVHLEWTHGINVRTAIGQGNNAFTPVQIGRYVAALANKETVYDLKLVNGITNHKENKPYESLPSKPLHDITVKEKYMDVVQQGMYRVVNGREGSARTSFADSKVTVAGKTGTAQEAKTEHSWFAGFAPYDDPQIAVVTTMYGAYGLGKHNYKLASDVFNLVLVPENQNQPATMESTFIQ